MPRNPQSPGRARTIATRSRARRLIAVAAASLLTMLVTAAGAHPQGGAWQSLDSNGDGYYDPATAPGQRTATATSTTPGSTWTRTARGTPRMFNSPLLRRAARDPQLRHGRERRGRRSRCATATSAWASTTSSSTATRTATWDTWRGSARRIIPRSNVDYMTPGRTGRNAEQPPDARLPTCGPACRCCTRRCRCPTDIEMSSASSPACRTMPGRARFGSQPGGRSGPRDQQPRTIRSARPQACRVPAGSGLRPTGFSFEAWSRAVDASCRRRSSRRLLR